MFICITNSPGLRQLSFRQTTAEKTDILEVSSDIISKPVKKLNISCNYN